MPIMLTGVGPVSGGSGPSAGSGLLLEGAATAFLLIESGSFLLLE